MIGGISQLGYLLWPAKRRWSNQNFGHVLGLPPDHPRVRRMALRAYREYATYMVELMRLPSRPLSELVDGVEGDGANRIMDYWRETGRPMIIVAGHVGNNEAVAASLALQNLPSNVVADDSAFPEIFDNLRELFTVLRRKEIVALLVDWGYRADGIPVRLFGAWTTLPAGPAVLAAKTGAIIAPMAIRRNARARMEVETFGWFDVPSSNPADLQRATQRIADALEATVRAAPTQWYSFKPVWPLDASEGVELEARAAIMLSGRPDPGPGFQATTEAARAGAS